MTTLSPSALGWLTGNSNPTCPAQFILSLLQTCSIPVSGTGAGFLLLHQQKPKTPPFPLLSKSNSLPSPAYVTFSVFLKSVAFSTTSSPSYTSPLIPGLLIPK